MSKIARFISLTLFLMLVLSACNLPSGSDPDAEGANAALTAAAQTVEANLTQSAELNPPTIPVIPTSTIALETATSIPTNTSPAPTSTQQCDLAQFITDVTIADGTTLDPNENFTKTWRLKNVGTCTWTPSYAVVFSSGEAMNGPATQALSGNVNPGQTVDISVNLKAPAADGSYKGYWKLRNAAGVLFAQFYVDIVVETPPPSETTITLNAVSGTESGTVYEPAAAQAVVHGTILAGDTGSDHLARGYMSFDISSISGKVVVEAKLDLSSCTKLNDPFGNLLGIWVGELQYPLPLDQADYDAVSSPIQLLTSLPGILDVTLQVQSRVTAGKSRFQIRLHPKGPSNGDGMADYMSCASTIPVLTIKYQP